MEEITNTEAVTPDTTPVAPTDPVVVAPEVVEETPAPAAE